MKGPHRTTEQLIEAKRAEVLRLELRLARQTLGANNPLVRLLSALTSAQQYLSATPSDGLQEEEAIALDAMDNLEVVLKTLIKTQGA